MQVRVPKSWDLLIKRMARQHTPPKTREAILFAQIEKYVNKVKKGQIK